MLKTVQHRFHLCELRLCFFNIVVQYPVAAVEPSGLSGIGFFPMHIFTDIRNDIIGIDGIDYGPGPGSHAVPGPGYGPKSPVGYRREAVRHRDAQAGTVRLIALMVLAGEPGAGAEALAGHAHPWPALPVAGKNPATVPGRTHGNLRGAFENHGHLVDGARFRRPGKADKPRISIAFKRQRLVAPANTGQLHRLLQVDLHTITFSQHPEMHGYRAPDAFGGIVGRNGDIIPGDIPPGATGTDAAAEGIRTGIGFPLAGDLRLQCSGQADRQANQQKNRKKRKPE